MECVRPTKLCHSPNCVPMQGGGGLTSCTRRTSWGWSPGPRATRGAGGRESPEWPGAGTLPRFIVAPMHWVLQSAYRFSIVKCLMGMLQTPATSRSLYIVDKCLWQADEKDPPSRNTRLKQQRWCRKKGATLHHLAIVGSGFGSRVPLDAVPVPNSVGHNSSL